MVDLKTNWMLRIPSVFEPQAPQILAQLGQKRAKRYGVEYHLACGLTYAELQASVASPMVSWQLPIAHSWPCNPAEMEGFIEKAAQALFKKFSDTRPQAILVGPLAGGGTQGYYKSLASNLRGRLLQVLPKCPVSTADDQSPTEATLFCLVGKEGLFAGLCTPQQAKGFHPGGTKFIKQSGAETISRAGAKIAEALHHLRLYADLPHPQAHWLELGASPGGMTSELLQRDYLVTAVDRAPMDARIARHPNLRFIQDDATQFEPYRGDRFDCLLSDLNGDAQVSFSQVLRLKPWLAEKALIVFTLKTPTSESYDELLALNAIVQERAKQNGLQLIAQTHLTYNRREFTLLMRC